MERDVRLLVRGDDFTVEMPIHEEKWFEGVLYSNYDGKCAEKFHSDAYILDGSFVVQPCDPVGHTSGRAELEADTRHIVMVLFRSGLDKSTLVVTLVVKRPKTEELLLAGAKRWNAEGATLYVTMRVKFVTLDRPDLSFAAGFLARGMESPTAKDFGELERVGRYL